MFVHRAIGMLVISAALTIQAQQVDPATHTWIGKPSPEVFEGRINDHLKRSDAALNRMLHVSGKRSVENTLAAYDEAIQELDTAGLQAGLLQEVHPDAALRDRAQALVQKVSAAQTALSLNPDVYRALSTLDVSNQDGDCCRPLIPHSLSPRACVPARGLFTLLYNIAHHISALEGLISAELRRTKCLARGKKSQLR